MTRGHGPDGRRPAGDRPACRQASRQAGRPRRPNQIRNADGGECRLTSRQVPAAQNSGGAQPGTTPDSYVVTLTVTGGGFNGTGPMNFELRDGRIARLRIS
jgi:hypothetical protein